MKVPSCSIIVPVFNRESLVIRTLDSIHAQTHRPISLIIVDNNSTDNTLLTITKWSNEHSSPDFQVTILSEPKQGAAAARNKGLSVVDSDYVMFFDSDDMMEPQHLSSVISTIRTHNNPDIVGWDVVIRHLDGKAQKMKFPSGDFLFRHFFNSILSTQRYAVKTEYIKNCGAWNERLPGWNDYELGIRLLLDHPRIARVNSTPKVTVIRQPESITGIKYSDKCSYWEKTLDELQHILPSHYRNVINLRRMVLAALYHHERSSESRRLRQSVLSTCGSKKESLILNFAYHYTAIGGRGIHYLLRPFLGF